MPHTLRQAAKAVGKDRATLLRAIRAGKLSATRDEAAGTWLVEPAELHRVYPPAGRTGGGAQKPAAHRGASKGGTRQGVRELQIRLDAAETRIADMSAMVDDLRRRLDEEHAERRQTAERLAEVQATLTAVLTDNRPAPATPPVRRSWWRWRSA